MKTIHLSLRGDGELRAVTSEGELLHAANILRPHLRRLRNRQLIEDLTPVHLPNGRTMTVEQVISGGQKARHAG